MKLPVIGTTAPTTSFCAQRLDGPAGTFLFLDGNQKITAGNGDYEHPMPNAFSLEAQAVVDREAGDRMLATNSGWATSSGEHCPGSTPTCRSSCYVHGLEKHAGDTYALYRHNSKEIRRILASERDAADAWVLLMADWITQNAAGGFRWHVSGDVFSADYARWIADVCRESPTVDHWIYTRSFDDDILQSLAAVATIHGGNLALNLSCDKDNYVKAKVTSQRFGNGARSTPLRLCYLVEESDQIVPPLHDGDVIFPDYTLRPKSLENVKDHVFWQSLSVDERAMLCPVDSWGKSEKIRCGPCARCLT